MQMNILSFFLFFSAGISLLVIFLSIERLGFTPLIKTFSFLMLAIFLSNIGYANELSFPNFIDKLFWVKVRYISNAFIPALWLIFVFSYTDSEKHLKKSLIFIYLLTPILTFLLILTNRMHHLVYRTFSLSTADGISFLTFERGPWLFLNRGYTLTCIILAFFVLLRFSKSVHFRYKPQIKIVFAAALIPSIFYISLLIFLKVSI